jgi:hypothetical protein
MLSDTRHDDHPAHGYLMGSRSAICTAAAHAYPDFVYPIVMTVDASLDTRLGTVIDASLPGKTDGDNNLYIGNYISGYFTCIKAIDSVS